MVDVPYGRILRCELKSREWEVLADFDGEANGLALNDEGELIVADYKNGLVSQDRRSPPRTEWRRHKAHSPVDEM